MRESPVKALLILITFYTLVLGAWFTFEAPEITLARLRTLTWIPWSSSIIEPVTHSLGLIDSFTLQKQVIFLWTPVVLGLTAFAILLGIALNWKYRNENQRQFELRRQGGFSRGIESKLGPVPELFQLPRKRTPLDWSEYPNEEAALAQMADEERALFDQILDTLYYHKDQAYVGAGHGVDLLEHSLDAFQEAVNSGFTDTLQLLAAIAHDMGKITAWKKVGNKWVRVGLHDRETAKILVTLPAFWQMPELRREALRLALKYDHAPSTLPILNNAELERLVAFLLKETAEADQRATAQEKLEVLHAVPLEDQVMEAFMSALPDLQFNTPSSQPGSKSDGWKKPAGSFDPPHTHTLYLLEQNLRQKAMMYLPEDTRSALGGIEWRERGVVAPFTEILLRELDKRKWLGTEVRAKPQRKNADGVWEFIHKEPQVMTQPVQSALWKILAGTSEFAGIIVIRLPDSEGMGLPMNDTKFGVFIQGPQFGAPPKASFDGLVGKARDVREAKQEKKAQKAQKENSKVESIPAAVVERVIPDQQPVVEESPSPALVVTEVTAPVEEEVKTVVGQVINTEGTSLFKGSGMKMVGRGGRGRAREKEPPSEVSSAATAVAVASMFTETEAAEVLAELESLPEPLEGLETPEDELDVLRVESAPVEETVVEGEVMEAWVPETTDDAEPKPTFVMVDD